MGYRTPNIDRLADEGVTFTDYYGQQSCTAGRAAFITGQNPLRTGLTKVGMPGADARAAAEDPTIAELLKPLGYATGQFGKNHLGDRDEFLPTNHGFDEFFGNLYHLNAEEEPEHPDYPKDPGVPQAVRPARRHPLHPRRRGGQTIEDTGPLTRKRMETIDDEITDRALGVHRASAQARASRSSCGGTRRTCTSAPTCREAATARAARASTTTPWSSTTSTSARCSRSSTSSASPTTPSSSTRPTTARTTTPGPTPASRRSAARRTPTGRAPSACLRSCAGRARFPAGKVLNGIVSHQDWLPTLLAAAGEPRHQGAAAARPRGRRQELQGAPRRLQHAALPDRRGRRRARARSSSTSTTTAQLVALRYGDWKIVFMEQRAKTMACWAEPFVQLRVPKIFNLRRDPFERADDNSNTYWDWVLDHAFMLVPAQAYVKELMETLKVPAAAEARVVQPRPRARDATEFGGGGHTLAHLASRPFTSGWDRSRLVRSAPGARLRMIE